MFFFIIYMINNVRLTVGKVNVTATVIPPTFSKSFNILKNKYYIKISYLRILQMRIICLKQKTPLFSKCTTIQMQIYMFFYHVK